ncbi:putative ankyrin repeat protein RF_0381 [Patella vulgata]|uniref:putative ankyrin repeat protein RF_0381 n=1 Tax=Patella vulgata TaxID=6465 RepID=UPI0024A8795C|nr:putative ankyrin repeat protein RF_0381 [Patella vulgata]XP_055958043.1 putative ankyrin repeat protein RF_0381 [Patella vulgata]
MSKYQGRQKGRMPENDYHKIRANFCYLLDHIKEPVILGNKLFEKNVFNADEKEEIQKIYMNVEKGRNSAADKLLMYVLSNCGDAYGKFIQCLRELGYREIVKVLENTTNGKNKTNLMTEQDKTRHQLEDLHKDHDLAKQESENLKKQAETQDGDSKQMLKKIEKLETYKKQTEEKEALTKKRIDELETCIKTLTLNEEDTVRQQLLHGTLSGNTSDTSDKKDTRQQQQQQLFDACRHGTLDDIKNMVDIDVNVRDSDDRTPLFKCCESSVSPVDKIQYLVSHQADINARDSYNNTILHWACCHGTLSTVQYLVDDLHMNVHTTGYYNNTPLLYCCMSSVSTVDKIKYLVSHEADINARNSHNNTILHWACCHGTLSTVQYLVDDLHMDVNTTGCYNQTPLFTCCMSSVSTVDKIQYLVSHQADINVRDCYNNTILHWACWLGTVSTVQYLVDDLHMNVHTTGYYNNTPLFYCCMSSVSPVDKIKYLVSHQADINVRDCYNDTILHRACWFGTLSTVEYLVDDLLMNVNTTGYKNQTPLFYCCRSSVSTVDKIKYLVSHQADINVRDCYNDTILHRACWFGTLSTVQYLVDCLHLDVHVKNKDGETVLDYCRKSDTEQDEKIKYIKAKSTKPKLSRRLKSLFRR